MGADDQLASRDWQTETQSTQLRAVGNLIFLSYRRADTAAQTLALRLALEARLGAAQIFFDTHTIPGGAVWPQQIADALHAAKVVVPVIGKAWFGQMESGERRIDDPEDWVHKEIALALDRKPDAIVPILTDGAPSLHRDNLPEPIKRLADIKPLTLNLEEWDKDTDSVIDHLKSAFRFNPKSADFPTPEPGEDKSKAKAPTWPWDELEALVRDDLPQWQMELSDDPGNPRNKRVELVRDFECGSFEQAMEFMTAIGKYASQSNHHPRLMIVWSTVRVWVSTWDIGYRITLLDTNLAKFVEREFRNKKYH